MAQELLVIIVKSTARLLFATPVNYHSLAQLESVQKKTNQMRPIRRPYKREGSEHEPCQREIYMSEAITILQYKEKH